MLIAARKERPTKRKLKITKKGKGSQRAEYLRAY